MPTETKVKTAKAATKTTSESATKAAAKTTAKAATKAAGKRFRVLLEKDTRSEATGIVVPFDAQKVFGTRARVAVRGTINGLPYRGSIFPAGDGTHYMVVRKQVRDAAGVKGGETVTVTMERDDEPRTVTPPADLARALKRDRAARDAWDKLSYTHRREYAELIEGAKRPETRARRVEKTLAQLAAGKKELFDR